MKSITILNLNDKQFQKLCIFLSKMGYEPIRVNKKTLDIWRRIEYEIL